MRDKPWLNEPDRVEFKYLGFDCLIQRVTRDYAGHLCGYVAVTKDHPWFGKVYDEVEVDVHGGLTYSRACEGKICHIVANGEDDNVWWFGFDCAHYDDFSPGNIALYEKTGIDLLLGEGIFTRSYKDIKFVENEIKRLARQLKAVA